MRDGLKTAGTLSIDRVEGGGIGETGVVECHAACFSKAQFCQDVADEDVVHIARLDVGTADGFRQYL